MKTVKRCRPEKSFSTKRFVPRNRKNRSGARKSSFPVNWVRFTALRLVPAVHHPAVGACGSPPFGWCLRFTALRLVPAVGAYGSSPFGWCLRFTARRRALPRAVASFDRASGALPFVSPGSTSLPGRAPKTPPGRGEGLGQYPTFLDRASQAPPGCGCRPFYSRRRPGPCPFPAPGRPLRKARR